MLWGGCERRLAGGWSPCGAPARPMSVFPCRAGAVIRLCGLPNGGRVDFLMRRFVYLTLPHMLLRLAFLLKPCLIAQVGHKVATSVTYPGCPGVDLSAQQEED